MAKSSSSKTNPQNTPLIISLVFFVLTTVAFGVMWYMAHSEQETHIANKKKAEDDLKTARTIAKEAEQIASFYRVVAGTSDAEEASKLTAEAKAGDKVAAEATKFNAAVGRKVGADGSALPADYAIVGLDGSGKVEFSGGKGLVDVARDATAARNTAQKQAAEDRTSYTGAMKLMSEASAAYAEARKIFLAGAVELPKKFKDKMDEIENASAKRLAEFKKAEGESRSAVDAAEDKSRKAERDMKTAFDQLRAVKTDNENMAARIAAADSFQFDEPQGKIIRRHADGTIEIDIGSDALVRRGLTFMVLPADFPQRGRQSRVMQEREPDGKGYFKNVNVFRQKANVEVVEVLGPSLSRCRLVGMDVQGQKRLEYDDIRDRVMVGDLLYHGIWRRGVADHVALVGIFDMNGDGTDDIQSVVRNLREMGIPVDAYFDLRTMRWEGRITERTRYVVQGHFPINSTADPNRDKKTALTAAMTAAVTEAKTKGIKPVGYRDFFPEMGYYVKVNVSDDKINQATARYLNPVPGDTPPPGGPGN